MSRPAQLVLTLLLALSASSLAHATIVVPPPPAAADDGWSTALHAEFAAIDGSLDGELGVHVYDLATGRAVSWQASHPWYLASGVKVPVAIAVLRLVQRGELALDSEIPIIASDFVDGAGPTQHKPAGTPLRVDWLLEKMLMYSDNTATDVLIRRVGIDAVNAVARELVCERCGHITTLADVRRHAYSALHPAASTLDSADLLAMKRADFGRARMDALAHALGVAPAQLQPGTIVSAFEAYYATELNAAPLDDYARMLAAIVQGRALAPQQTEWLLDVMARAHTGRRRIVAGLPDDVRFAHKTGTQVRRQCDFGIASRDLAGAGVVIAACVRGASLAAGEKALRAVGAAVASSGVLDDAYATPAIIHAAAPATPATAAGAAQ